MSGPSTEPKKKPSMMRMPTGVKKEKPKSEEDDDFDMSMLNADHGQTSWRGSGEPFAIALKSV